jgi:hypothetical protein
VPLRKAAEALDLDRIPRPMRKRHGQMVMAARWNQQTLANILARETGAQ